MVSLSASRPRATCTRCGSDLSARFRGTVTRRFQGVAYRCDLYQCGCSRRHYIRRAVIA
jgi:hypothetical protein